MNTIHSRLPKEGCDLHPLPWRLPRSNRRVSSLQPDTCLWTANICYLSAMLGQKYFTSCLWPSIPCDMGMKCLLDVSTHPWVAAGSDQKPCSLNSAERITNLVALLEMSQVSVKWGLESTQKVVWSWCTRKWETLPQSLQIKPFIFLSMVRTEFSRQQVLAERVELPLLCSEDPVHALKASLPNQCLGKASEGSRDELGWIHTSWIGLVGICLPQFQTVREYLKLHHTKFEEWTSFTSWKSESQIRIIFYWLTTQKEFKQFASNAAERFHSAFWISAELSRPKQFFKPKLTNAHQRSWLLP